MTELTEFGDPAVVLPLALAVLTWLLLPPGRDVAAAGWWFAAVGLCVGATALLKLYLYPCPQGALIRNPSGHVSLSVLVYGGIAVVLGTRLAGWRRLVLGAGAAAVVAGISASRVLINAHTSLEVVLGAVIGLASLAVFARSYPRNPAGKFSGRWLCFGVLLLVAVLHGQTLHAEGFLHRLDAYLRFKPLVCP